MWFKKLVNRLTYLDMYYCKEHGHIYGGKFCGDCGKLGLKRPRCSSCNMILSVTYPASYCGYCGVKLN